MFLMHELLSKIKNSMKIEPHKILVREVIA